MRRIDDRIRKLCQELIAEQDLEKFQSLAAEFREAIHEYVQRLRARLDDYPIVHDRRSMNGLAPPETLTPETSQAQAKPPHDSRRNNKPDQEPS
jgi:hypothetical protein